MENFESDKIDVKPSYEVNNNSYKIDIVESLNSKYTQVLKEITPEISMYNQVLQKKDKGTHLNTFVKSYFEQIIRESLIEFDNSVNFFGNNQIGIYNDDLIVDRTTDLDNDYSSFILHDENNKMDLSIIRTKDGFAFRLKVISLESYETNIYHCYEECTGEQIIIDKSIGTDFNVITYNLSNNIFLDSFGNVREATLEDKKVIIEYINKYTALAKYNMQKNMVKVKK